MEMYIRGNSAVHEETITWCDVCIKEKEKHNYVAAGWT